MPTLALPNDACILIVDDEFLVLWSLKDALQHLGFHSIVTASSVREARAILDKEPLSFAFLDVNLGSEKSFGLAAELELAGIPFAFVTGYGRSGLEGKFENTAVLSKPIDFAALAQTVAPVG